MATRARSELIADLRFVGFSNGYVRDLTNEAADAIEQLTTELDARFQHSDHTAAKYYQRMRDAEKELERTIDRIGTLIAPWTARIDLEQIGTHADDCQTYHRDCLILAIQWTLKNGDHT